MAIMACKTSLLEVVVDEDAETWAEDDVRVWVGAAVGTSVETAVKAGYRASAGAAVAG
jgi:hypothetical protein